MLLFTPGPTPVPEFVRQAMATPTIHHRTPEFEAIFKSTREKLLKLYGMDDVVMLATSGTGAMEASVLNLCQKKILTVNSGKFGERFGKIAQAFGKELIELKYEWNTPVNIADVEAILKENSDIDTIALQVSESAGGLRHPVEALAKVVKGINKDIMIIADGITAVGVEKIDTTHIDALLSGSQKAFMLPPGLAMIGLSGAAVERIGKGMGYYLNLASEIKKQRDNTTAYTAATTLIIGLGAVLDAIEEEGVENLYDQTNRRGVATRAALQALGLQVYPTTPAKSMTTIIDDKANEIRDLLKTDFGVNVAGGQDHLKGKIFRINQMGLIPVNESVWVVNAVELALDKLGLRTFTGLASETFNKTYYGLS
ncbi:MAG: alanine--glyoxylate aminotransferase family protein [Thiovulaceae bacterium]|nr:alanine--glyoxylate aminotransferase family protein [Sulfurimonadaceae bacterium]